jgi:RNA polymerase sigma-70 factor (ECF subfamily)
MEELARWLDRAARRDQAAYLWLYRSFRPVVVRLCGAFATLDADEVEDVVQESFVRAFRRLATLRSPEAFEPWLLSIARNRALSLLSRKGSAQRAQAALESPDAQQVELLPDALKREVSEAVVREVISSLPDGPEKETARLFYVEGRLNARQIAEQQGVGKSAVTMRLERFRARVKRELVYRLARSRLS